MNKFQIIRYNNTMIPMTRTNQAVPINPPLNILNVWIARPNVVDVDATNIIP